MHVTIAMLTSTREMIGSVTQILAWKLFGETRQVNTVLENFTRSLVQLGVQNFLICSDSELTSRIHNFSYI